MGHKKRQKPKKRLYAKPVFPPHWPRDANGKPMFSALWPKDEHGEFKVVAETDTGWSGEGKGALLAAKEVEQAENDFRADFGSITLELDFEFTEIDE